MFRWYSGAFGQSGMFFMWCFSVMPGVHRNADVIEMLLRLRGHEPADRAEEEQEQSGSEEHADGAAIRGAALDNPDAKRQHHQIHAQTSDHREAENSQTT